jgi:superfamily I DNA and/or RNA helicase
MLGAENDIVILASTRSNSSRDLGFMNQPELLNVATSRQLMKLIIIGDAAETFADVDAGLLEESMTLCRRMGTVLQ